MLEIRQFVNLINKKMAILCAFFLATQTKMTFAHAADQGFVLLLPTDIYITSGVLSVAASIIFVALVSNRYLSRIFQHIELASLPDFARSRQVVSVASSFFLAGLILIGLFGPRNPLDNPLPLFIWSVWWVAIVLIQGLVGNIWRWINPWTGVYRLCFQNGSGKPILKLPPWVEQWPAVFIFVLFGMFFLADPAPSDPSHLAEIVFSYWMLTFVAMIIFGGKEWLQQGECFTILLQLLSKLSPMQIGRTIKFGFFGWAVVSMQKSSVPLAIICLLLLGLGSFDGLNETFWWLGILGVNPLEFPGKSAIIVETISGLFFASFGLILLFSISTALGMVFANIGLQQKKRVDFKTAFVNFAPTVLPIALGYHFAHYLTAVLVDWQYLKIAITDPFATGANYLGFDQPQVTTGFFADQEIVRQIWITQAVAVVGSHIIAVLLTHAMAAKLYTARRNILLSELPLAVFMIVYTLFGLWLLASPRGA